MEFGYPLSKSLLDIDGLTKTTFRISVERYYFDAMEKARDNTLTTQRGLHGLAALSFKALIRLKEDEDREAFNKLIQTLLPDVECNIARRLGGP